MPLAVGVGLAFLGANIWVIALSIGLTTFVLATLALVYVVQSAGPSFMSLVNYQVPVWAVILGLVVLDEALPPQFLGALALILSGLAVSQLRLPLRRG